MAVTPAAQRGVFGLACRIKLNGDTRPVVHDISKPVTAGLPSDDNAALAGLLGDGRDSGQTAQSGVVAPLQAIPSLCEQRGEDNPSNSRQGCKDFHVMLLLPPRPGILCWDEPGWQGVQPAMSLFDLPVHKADARHERLDMGAGRFNRSPCNLHSRFAQDIQNMGGVEAPDAVALQQLGYRPLADARGLAGCGCEFPQVEQPWGAKIAFELQHGGKVAPKLLAQAVGEPVTLRAKIACNARPLAVR